MESKDVLIMAKVGTITETIRIPEDLAQSIDKIISKSGNYTNRPDFILSAIRFQLADMIDLMENAWEHAASVKDNALKVYFYYAIMDNLRKNFQDNYSIFDGKPVTISIRTPPGLSAQICMVSSRSLKISELDFIRISISRYYFEIEDRSDRESIIFSKTDDSIDKIDDSKIRAIARELQKGKKIININEEIE